MKHNLVCFLNTFELLSSDIGGDFNSKKINYLQIKRFSLTRRSNLPCRPGECLRLTENPRKVFSCGYKGISLLVGSSVELLANFLVVDRP